MTDVLLYLDAKWHTQFPCLGKDGCLTIFWLARLFFGWWLCLPRTYSWPSWNPCRLAWGRGDHGPPGRVRTGRDDHDLFRRVRRRRRPQSEPSEKAREQRRRGSRQLGIHASAKITKYLDNFLRHLKGKFLPTTYFLACFIFPSWYGFVLLFWAVKTYIKISLL